MRAGVGVCVALALVACARPALENGIGWCIGAGCFHTSDGGAAGASPDLALAASPDLARSIAPGDLSGPVEDLSQSTSDLATSGSCAHPICTAGSKLTSGCDPCVTQVCAHDAYCCSTTWNSICVGEVTSVCGHSCP
jgi:hypothetical protein